MFGIRKSAWLLAAASGVLQVLIFPTPNLNFLCWIALAPLLAAVLRARDPETLQMPETLGQPAVPAKAWQGFLLGYLTGLISLAGTCYWIYHVMHYYGGLSSSAALGILLLFCLYVGLHNGLFGLLLAWSARPRPGVRGALQDSTRLALLLAPVIWVAVELARTRITGFPWDLLGTVQVDNIPLGRIATVTGVYGLSFEIMLVNSAFAAAFLARRSKRKILLVAALATAAVVQITSIVRPPPLPAPETARLIQEDIPLLNDSGWTPESFRDLLADLRARSLEKNETSVGEPPPSLIVWPESPAPFYVWDRAFREAVSSIAIQANAYLITGSVGANLVAPGQPPRRLFNSASLIGPSGQWESRYDKIHLVPFGEYVPFQSVFAFAGGLTRAVGDFEPGTERNVFRLGRYRAGVFICYESIFPAEIRQFAVHGGQVFVNISDDGWYGNTAAPEQHLNMARMRAIENGRWLLRATNTGITAAVDPFGRVVASVPRNQRTSLDAPFSLVNRLTFYTRHGDWFAFLCAIITVAALMVLLSRRIHSRPRLD